jgi:hypothetical protein
MGAVFDVQFQNLRDAFARAGRAGGTRDIRVARDRAGHPLYVYEADRVLVRVDGRGLDPAVRETVRNQLRRRGIDPSDRAFAGGLVLQDTAGQDVPALLDDIDRQFDVDPHPVRMAPRSPAADGVGANHVVGIAKICPAGEPTVPEGDASGPWPAQEDPTVTGKFRVKVGVSDTGLVQPVDVGLNPWLGPAGSAVVDGDPDVLGPVLPSGLPRIDEFTGHGTFIAGVVGCTAPSADVYVNDHFSSSGGELENVMIDKVNELVRVYQPQIVNLSAGTYSRRDWVPLGLTEIALRLRDDGIVLVAAAGNDSTDRPFYPAALPRGEFPNIVSVGAVGADLTNPAWFTNYGTWVDVYALGEMRNAYPVGEYTYQEPPRRPNVQQFTQGLARWEGTSFSAPAVAGMIADRIARTGEAPTDALAAVLAAAQPLPALPCRGRALLPGARP